MSHSVFLKGGGGSELLIQHLGLHPKKAGILNQQFTLVFTTENPCEPLPVLGDSPHPTVSNITVIENGVQELLEQLNPHKSTGPDEVSSHLLKVMASQIAPALTRLFQAT
jgi:hypothetical protein